ncbi:MAG: hypothetical protein GY716_07515 [bacterium]|nr:hypothetical protein [bacterium]
MSSRRSIVRILCVALAALLWVSVAATDEPAEPQAAEEAGVVDAERAEPIDLGLYEESEVRRLFVDVEALDKKGRPMPGLVKDDFKIRLNYLWRKIKTVDDLCPCSVDSGAGLFAKEATLETDPVRAAEIETRYVIYLDLSQLSAGGRHEALNHVRGWIARDLRDEVEVMIVVYDAHRGLVELTPFTSDREQMTAALDEATSYGLDDEFTDEYAERLGLCAEGTLSCYYMGRKEHFRSDRSLGTLLGFLTRMERIGGRKVMFFFHQNLSMFPGRMYADPGQNFGSRMLDGRPSDDVPDLIEMLAEVGAAATMSRTAVYPFVMGGGSKWTVNMGANLADFTGGRYNHSRADIVGLIDEAGRGCKCIYRVGVEPPSERSRVYRSKVRIRGQSLRTRPRVHYLTDRDLWARKTGAVLTNPNDSWDFEVDAALIPQRLENDRWNLDVQVLLDISQLEPPLEGGPLEWEVGALVAYHRDGVTKRVWEMLGVSRAPEDPAGRSRLVLHEHELEDLRPGEYEIRAFVRDRNGDRFGGAQEQIELPGSKRGGIAGPLALGEQQAFRVYTLPEREEEDTIPAVEVVDPTDRWVPIGLAGAKLAAPVTFRSWVCSPRKSVGEGSLRRSVTDGEQTVLELGRTERPPPGECTTWRDDVELTELPDGGYVYRVDRDAEDDPTAKMEFEIRQRSAHVGSPD